MTAAKSTRATNVQIPGQAPKAPEPVPQPPATTGPDTSALRPTDEVLQARVAAINTPPAATSAPSDALDMEALRAHIREEERAILRDEFSAQMQAASKAIEGTVGASAMPQRSKADYANMRAVDIDPATLTAPVRTLDGYLCPPAPEAKK